MKIIQKPSPSFDSRESKKSTMILLHYTGMRSAKDALDRLTDESSKVSSHYTIDEEGSVYQHVDERDRAWHAGKSYWQGETNINSVSIGIEIVNPGHEFGYKEFPDVQMEAVQELCKEIMGRYEIEQVLAHSDVAPDRKQDPGELFPWEAYAQKEVGIWPAVSDEDIVKGAGLDVARALYDVGYGYAMKLECVVTAFQRHYVPEAFEKGTQGQVCGLTRGRLYALLSGHVIGGY
jgi:N-acetylmuramoyl-L-alanine amidase